MNYQKHPSDEVLNVLKSNYVEFYEISYYAWPQTFSNTAGPCEGFGGQAISIFTVEAWVCNNEGPTVYVCGNKYFFEDDKFKPFKNIKHWVSFK